MHEFSIIDHYFKSRASLRQDVLLGIGDDAALLSPPTDQALVVTTDTLIAGVHFFPDIEPKPLGHKALAVNLSDLAAMGAEPAWVTLNLAIPNVVHNDWLTHFCDGFFELAKRYSISLVGGDLVRGPLTVTVQATGFIKPEETLQRDGAQPGDLIFVSGKLGDAGAALCLLKEELTLNQEDANYLLQKLYYPEPRIELGQALRGIASSAIDISDGLAADLQHILSQSSVGAVIQADDLPLSSVLINQVREKEAKKLALSAGDDYELCFTISEEKSTQYQDLLNRFDCNCIGRIEPGDSLRILNSKGGVFELPEKGYQHF